jgi:hypothetical protein
MTNERAIELLNRISDSQFDGEYGDERREALDMAVRALEQNLVQESGGLVQDLVKDCISRKMAIDEVKRLHDVAWANWKETRISANTMIDALKDLPSAQPETHDKRTETHECDLISRQAAIDAVKDLPNCRNGFSDTYDKACIIGVLEDLPTAQTQRKKGRWIWWYEEAVTEHATEYTPHCKCSECGRECAPSVATYSNFCRNCGADMRGECE